MTDREELSALTASLRRALEVLGAAGTHHVPAAPAPAELPPADPSGRTLAQVRAELGDCQRCKLAPSRTHIVFGTGSPSAPLVFVGEAPGAQEDARGEPFVGDAGQLLDRMIAAMGWQRSDVYICNILKCRPPGNRNPEPDEVQSCVPFLRQQLDVLSPRVIVALGKFAAQFLCDQPGTPIGRLRGRFHQYMGIDVMPTYHPAYLLRNPSAKKQVWDDLQKVMSTLTEAGVHTPKTRA